MVDDSGVALVDDDCFEIWEHGPDKCGGEIAEGSQIEVVGPARWCPALEVAALGAGSYRGQQFALCFDGKLDCPVLLLISP